MSHSMYDLWGAKVKTGAVKMGRSSGFHQAEAAITRSEQVIPRSE